MMRLFNNWPQKLIALLTLALALIALSFAPINAESASPIDCKDEITCLKSIAQITNNILVKIDNLPAYITAANSFFLNLTSADGSDHTSQLQSQFTIFTNHFLTTNNELHQNANLIKLTADNLGVPLTSFNTTAGSKPAILNMFPEVNDTAYSTILGMAPVTVGAEQDPYNYLRNVTGMNLNHSMPNSIWQGKDTDQQRYKNYYSTIMAIQNFSAYILDNILKENKNNQFAYLQDELLKKASDPNWFTNIGAQEIGKVMRQLLLFQSQNYVLISNLLKTQKQLLTAQAMTNTLLIIRNRDSEMQMLYKAQGIKPRP